MTCIVNIECFKCSFGLGSYIQIKAQEQQSYANKISINVTAFSSIPSEYSTTKVTITPNYNNLYRGSTPTLVDIVLLQSAFKSYVTSTENTGYHVLFQEWDNEGSQYESDEIQYKSDLLVTTEFLISDVALQTIQTPDQTWVTLINSILGTIVGLLGTIGAVMSITEPYLGFKIFKLNFQKQTLLQWFQTKQEKSFILDQQKSDQGQQTSPSKPKMNGNSRKEQSMTEINRIKDEIKEEQKKGEDLYKNKSESNFVDVQERERTFSGQIMVHTES